MPVERAHRTSSIPIDARTALAINAASLEQGQTANIARLTPTAFGEATSVGAGRDDETPGPRTASTVAATLALVLFFFLRRVS